MIGRLSAIIFRDNRVPVFVAKYYGRRSYLGFRHPIICNGLLRELEFFRVFDPYTAFQEIAMHVGGVLGAPNKPVPEVSDKDMVSAKGFNEWSFRKPPRGS